MEFEKVVLFKNWSLEDFTGRFNSEDYVFVAGATYSVPSSLAIHFARQLAVRELHRIGTAKAEMLSEQDMNDYMGRCFPLKEQQPSMASSFERIDEVKDGEAKAAVPVKENKTESDIQKESSEEENDDETVEEVKNNAGELTFKRPVGRPPKSRDAQYV